MMGDYADDMAAAGDPQAIAHVAAQRAMDQSMSAIRRENGIPGDLILTWPKSKPLATYLGELLAAYRLRKFINYRIGSRRPRHSLIGHRSWMIYNHEVRGWLQIVDATWRERGEVHGGDWPEGYYIVRSAYWHPITPIPMRSFQGFRYVK